MKLILGSASKHRKEILEKEGYIFDVLVSDIDERKIKTDNPRERPLVLARAKADALAAKVKEPAFIITSDTVIIAGGELREKPETEGEARKFLKEYSAGVAPEAITAVVIMNTETGKRYEGVDTGKTFFKHLPDSFVEDFIKYGEPLTLAGGFGVGHPLMKPYIERIEGDAEAIIGMPAHLLKDLLSKAGYKN